MGGWSAIGYGGRSTGCCCWGCWGWGWTRSGSRWKPVAGSSLVSSLGSAGAAGRAANSPVRSPTRPPPCTMPPAKRTAGWGLPAPGRLSSTRSTGPLTRRSAQVRESLPARRVSPPEVTMVAEAEPLTRTATPPPTGPATAQVAGSEAMLAASTCAARRASARPSPPEAAVSRSASIRASAADSAESHTSSSPPS
ncbi:hypothetical protein ACFQ0B_36275 [Nonomuraea thailandensis]